MSELLGYARVSTAEQTLDLQSDALTSRDVRGSGPTSPAAATTPPGTRQPVLTSARGDTLVVWRLDRLGRNLPHLLQTITDLEERRRLPIVDRINRHHHRRGKLIFNIFGALASFERDPDPGTDRGRARRSPRPGQGRRPARKMTDSRIRQARKMREGGCPRLRSPRSSASDAPPCISTSGRRRVEGAAINECREAELHAVVGSTDVDRPSAVGAGLHPDGDGRRCLGVRRRHRLERFSLGESRSASTTRGVAARCELTARGFKISSASMRPFERRIERRCDCSQNGDAARNIGDVSVPRYPCLTAARSGPLPDMTRFRGPSDSRAGSKGVAPWILGSRPTHRSLPSPSLSLEHCTAQRQGPGCTSQLKWTLCCSSQ
ncbi:recombinase family protein [Rhodococcus hoagii]|nr:recombinase family protein [Prescottella equi]